MAIIDYRHYCFVMACQYSDDGATISCAPSPALDLLHGARYSAFHQRDDADKSNVYLGCIVMTLWEEAGRYFAKFLAVSSEFSY